VISPYNQHLRHAGSEGPRAAPMDSGIAATPPTQTIGRPAMHLARDSRATVKMRMVLQSDESAGSGHEKKGKERCP
jgi:hypothetical protein